MSVSASELTHYSLVRISGADRAAFLQGQLTQDIDTLTVEKSALAGWATAKGRLLMIGQLIAWQESFFLPVPAEISETLIQRLRMFILRARVDVESSDYPVTGLCGLGTDTVQNLGDLALGRMPDAVTSNHDICIARVIGDPGRAWLIGDIRNVNAFVETETRVAAKNRSWDLQNIRMGLPVVCQATSEAFIPQMVNLDLIGGISFNKGCYLGQEIVARTQNLGRIKRRMYRFGTNSVLQVSSGMNIYGPGGTTGKIVMAADDQIGTELLAVVPINESGAQWFADEEHAVPLERRALPYSIPE